MAKAEIKMPEDFLLRVSQLADRTDVILPKVLKAGGEVVLAKVKGNLQAVIGSGTKYLSKSTGELVSSLGLSPAKIDNSGVHNVKVGFNEPRRKQTKTKGKRSYGAATNAMIAGVIEYGKHGQPAKPFLKPAKSASRKACEETMRRTLEEEIENL